MILAIPLGLLLGYLLIPFVNMIFASTFAYQGSMFYLSSQTLVATGAILLFEVFWCSLLNLGYCVRSTINSMMNQENQIDLSGIKGPAISHRLFIACYFMPPVIFLFLKDLHFLESKLMHSTNL